MQRLTAEDGLMLWPDAIWPQEHGALAILDGGALLDPDGRVRVEDVRHMIEGRLHLVPRLRQVLVAPRRGLGGPLWVDAPAFDLGDHVRVLPLPAPGDEAVLLRAVERLRRRRLDRSRPLWEMWFLTGLPDRRVALFVRMHHAMADGIAAMATIGAFLDTVPDATSNPAPPWTPAPPPTARELVADNLRQHIDGMARALATLARPAATARRVRSAWPAVRGLLNQPRTPATSLNRRVGPDRVLALVRTTLDEVSAIAHAHDATVNDVLLAVTAGGLRALLGERGEPVDGVTMRISVPITLRHGSRAQARGNLISQMIVPLPIGVPDPGQRLRLIAAETSRRKAEPHPPWGRCCALRSPGGPCSRRSAADRST